MGYLQDQIRIRASPIQAVLMALAISISIEEVVLPVPTQGVRHAIMVCQDKSALPVLLQAIKLLITLYLSIFHLEILTMGKRNVSMLLLRSMGIIRIAVIST